LLFHFYSDYNDTVGSLSSPWDSFEEANGDTIHSEVVSSGLSDMASSSGNNSRQSGWTSSEDEADIMDQDDEGLVLSVLYVSIMWFRFLFSLHRTF